MTHKITSKYYVKDIFANHLSVEALYPTTISTSQIHDLGAFLKYWIHKAFRKPKNEPENSSQAHMFLRA